MTPPWQKWCPARDVVVSAIKGQALWELGEKDTFIVPDYFQNLERNTEDWVLMIMRPINGLNISTSGNKKYYAGEVWSLN